jgi:hypothetical protein
MKDDATLCSTSDTFSLSSSDEGLSSSNHGDADTVADSIYFAVRPNKKQSNGQKSDVDSKLARTEQTWVFRSKCLAAVVLFGAATAMATQTYRVMITQDEKKDFETQVSPIRYKAMGCKMGSSKSNLMNSGFKTYSSETMPRKSLACPKKMLGTLSAVLRAWA